MGLTEGYGPGRRERVISAIAAVTLQGLVVFALMVGLGVSLPPHIADQLRLINVLPEPPPPPPVHVVPPRERSPRPEAAAAPPNLRATPTEIVMPPPPVPIPLPPPVIAAPVAAQGSQATAGAADVVGPGTGAGGQGNGLGSGNGGNGNGGGGLGRDTGPHQTRGELRDSDYPRGAASAGAEGAVSVRFSVEVDGRVTHCRITESSGNRELDITTCRLIEERYRFRPARDAQGNPVLSFVEESHDWVIHDERPRDEPR